MSKFKTFYEGHDEAYKKRKAAGRIGWDTAEGTSENLKIFASAFQNPLVPKNGKVLELGCGAGDISIMLGEIGYKISGIDISETAIVWAKEKAAAKNIEADFRVGNVLDLSEFEEQSFDIVLDGHCLHCIIGEDRKKFLSEAFRVLKNGGLFITGTMCNEWTKTPIEGISEYFDEKTRCLISRNIATRYIGKDADIIEEIKQYGFEVVDTKLIPKKSDDDCDELFVWAMKKDESV